MSAVTAPPVDAATRAGLEAEKGAAAMARGDFAAAVDFYRRAVTLRPAEANYHLQLGVAADKAGRDEWVEAPLLAAIRLNASDPWPHYVLSAWHYRHGRIDHALEHSERAMALSPGDRVICVSRASILLAAGKGREAWDLLEPFAAANVPDRWVAQLAARAAPAAGREEDALWAIERALLAPGLGDGPDGKPLLHFAAATLLDRLGRADEAFGHARAGNELVRNLTPRHDPAAHSEWISSKIRYFTRKRLKSLPRATLDTHKPVFIVGMPRSGTSLVEQILSCHPQVHGAGELNALRVIARDASGADWSEGAAYPAALDGLSLATANRLARQYLASTGAPNGVTYVTDKQPLNFQLLDLVELLFPECHVIHCVRNPLDTCLSCYLTNFQESNAFKYDLGHLGAYHRDYRRLMEHWKKVLNVPILEVRYEDVVLDAEGQTRRLLEFLNLPWDDRCLRYYENNRQVRTASLDQVRRPIYTTSIGRWKHYEKHLGELITALGRPTEQASAAPAAAGREH